MERLRAQLTNDADHKLHKLLGDRVARTPGKTGFLPSKVECAKLLVKRIDAAAKIPACIQEFFRMKFGSPI
jgi:hypothetical protein